MLVLRLYAQVSRAIKLQNTTTLKTKRPDPSPSLRSSYVLCSAQGREDILALFLEHNIDVSKCGNAALCAAPDDMVAKLLIDAEADCFSYYSGEKLRPPLYNAVDRKLKKR